MSSPVRERKLRMKSAKSVRSGAGRSGGPFTRSKFRTPHRAGTHRLFSTALGGRHEIDIRIEPVRKALCTVVIAVCVTLAGCQTTQTRSSMEARHFDAADPCQPIRSRLIGTQDHFSANIGGGIAIGVITGIITGLQQSDDKSKALKRAIIGGLAGAAAGYLKGKLEQAESREELRDAINSDVQRDTHKVTEMGSILRNLNECRQNQVAAVRRDFDDGSVNRAGDKSGAADCPRQRSG